MEKEMSLWDIAFELDNAAIDLDRIHSLIALSFGVYEECPELDNGFGHYYEAVLFSAMVLGKKIEENLQKISDVLHERSKEERALKAGA